MSRTARLLSFGCIAGAVTAALGGYILLPITFVVCAHLSCLTAAVIADARAKLNRAEHINKC